MAQKMCFPLNACDICFNEFGYSWNYHGPYSAGLQSQLRALDQNEELVSEFYQLYNEFDLFSNESKQGTVFTEYQKTNIDKISDSLSIKKQVIRCVAGVSCWVQ